MSRLQYFMSWNDRKEDVEKYQEEKQNQVQAVELSNS